MDHGYLPVAARQLAGVGASQPSPGGAALDLAGGHADALGKIRDTQAKGNTPVIHRALPKAKASRIATRSRSLARTSGRVQRVW